jgi:hypothetical protein
MGARFGSLLTRKASTFLRAPGTLLAVPALSARAVAISRLHSPIDGEIHRLYTACGDAGETGPDTRAFVQLYTHGDEILEAVYFRRLLRWYPTTDDDQQAFLGENGAGLGTANFSILREQLGDLGLDEALLAQAFGEAESIDFERAAGTPQDDWVAPYRGTERRINDAHGDTGLRQDVVFMPYARTLAGGAQEQLLISTEIVSDRDGDTAAREIHVDFLIGLPLSHDGVLVQ